MASNNSPTDSWLQFYQQTTSSATSSVTGGVVSDSTVVLGQQGSRPIRRRSRAPRRTPTTVLNTDPANFRAMVQQFTGGYANTTSPYPVQVSSSVYPLPTEAQGFINFGVENGSQHVSSETVYRQFLQLQLQQQQHQQQQQQGHDGHDSENAFLMHRIRSFRSDVDNNGPFRHQ